MTTQPRQRTIGNLTPTALLAEITRATAALDRARDEVKRLTEYIGALELAARLAGATLTSIRKHRSVSPVDVNATAGPLDSYTKRAATRSNRTHVGLKKLYEQNVTQASLARDLKETRSRVAAWFAKGRLNRPIPRRQAVYLRDKYGIPESVWERITD